MTLPLWEAVRLRRIGLTHGLDIRVRWRALRPAGTSTVVIPGRVVGRSTVTDIERRAEALAATYAVAVGEVRRLQERADHFELVLRTSAMPIARQLPKGSDGLLYPIPAASPIPLGVDVEGQTVSIELFNTAGGSSVLIGGVPGSGKSNALRVLLHHLTNTNASIAFVDPAGGAEAQRWRGQLAAIVDTAEAGEASEVFDLVLSIIDLRGRLLSAGEHRERLRPVVLIVDELAEMGAASEPKEAEQCRRRLRRIVSLGRKANVAVVMATQRTTATSIDVTTRALAAYRLALAHPGDVYGSEALLGPGRKQAAELRKADVGSGYLTDGGPPELLRVFRASEPLPNKQRPLGLSEVLAWDEVNLRERLARL